MTKFNRTSEDIARNQNIKPSQQNGEIYLVEINGLLQWRGDRPWPALESLNNSSNSNPTSLRDD